ncbi:hypothetical protein BC938DRAFT_482818, partial [Jimgerdemannia flammicorona]
MADAFRLHDELIKLQEDPKDYFIPNSVTIEGANDKELERYLIGWSFHHLKTHIVARLFDIILSGFQAELKATSDDIDGDETDSFPQHRLALEMYGFVLQWFVNIAEEKSTSKVVAEKAIAAAKPKVRFSIELARLDLSTFSTWFDLTILISRYLIFWPLPSIPIIQRGRAEVEGIRPHGARAGSKDQQNLDVDTGERCVHQIFENKDNTKAAAIKMSVFKILGICIKNFNQSFAAQTTIIQDLQYWEHSADMMAEFLFSLAEQHDYTQLTDEILREIGNKEFKDTTTKEVKDTPNPKTFAAFLTRLSELLPRSVLKNMQILIRQLDSEVCIMFVDLLCLIVEMVFSANLADISLKQSYMMRMAIIEILGNLITELANMELQSLNQKDQINNFFDILEERFLDNTAFCRSKLLQVYLKLLEWMQSTGHHSSHTTAISNSLRAKFPKRRQTLCDLAIRHLEDKSSHVRKNAIKVLTRLIATHPYSMYGGELILEQWENRRDEIMEKMAALKPPEELQEVPREPEATGKRPNANGKKKANDDEGDENEERSVGEQDSDEEMEDADAAEEHGKDAVAPSSDDDAMLTDEQMIGLASPEKYVQLDLTKRFCTDAITFIMQIHAATPIIVLLLASKTKAEVLEAMDFLVMANNYRIDAASDGIKKMLHLIWTKDNSDEGKGVKTKLLDCYRTLYLELDGNLSPKENVNKIARNLIQLTFNTTLAELTSLEQVLSTLMTEGHIEDDVIDKLWAVYAHQMTINAFAGVTKREIPKAQRRGAIIILGMLAKARMEIVSEKTDTLLKIGLGSLGKVTMMIIASSFSGFRDSYLILEINTFSVGFAQADLSLAKYTCMALQRLGGNKTKEKGRALDEGIRLPMSLPIFERLRDIVDGPSTSTEWYAVAEQAINTIYLLGEHPDILCAEIIKTKTMQVFGNKAPETKDAVLKDEMQVDEEIPSAHQDVLPASSVQLSQLLFVVGHVAVKHIVHLEIIEAVWKRKKAKTE